MTMSSSRPYLIRALYEWILDNDSTPYILVNAHADEVSVPQEHVKDGQIILNISPTAVQNLNIENEAMDFSGRFAGVPTRVHVPIVAVLGIYARENGQGMFFETDDTTPEPPKPEKSGDNQIPKLGRPSLRVVK
ncbi:MAG: ClpXP protease specificity-enhancing factor [Gammaproteobacteria bacterium]|nr:ClpXP protease specificity-enhancing factor [Gammaproteobacteria bacterium]